VPIAGHGRPPEGGREHFVGIVNDKTHYRVQKVRTMGGVISESAVGYMRLEGSLYSIE
jgi:hypothetical protein